MRLSSVAAVFVTGAVLLTGCGAAPPPGDAARIDQRLVADLKPGDAQAVGQAVNAFGLDLFGEVADGEKNTITSPLSVAVLLAMVMAGAQGDTATEMARVLHLGDRRDVRVGALLRLLSDTDQVKLSVADALWAGTEKQFQPDYLKFVGDTFGATVEQGDLGSQETARKIDAWAEKNTNGLIRDIAKDLALPDPTALMVLLNAVYFLGEWKTTFDTAQTAPRPFTLPGGGKVEVPMMHMSGRQFEYAEREGFRMLRLPYGKDGRYGMEVLLPDDGGSLAGMLDSLDAARWRAAVDSLSPTTVDELALPRFELRWKGELTKPLQRLGMVKAFSGMADFRSMSPQNSFLQTVVHKTYIRVDERGTEAAAVTGGVMSTSATAGQTIFRVDRPFAFTISDRTTGTIVFLGSVIDPR